MAAVSTTRRQLVKGLTSSIGSTGLPTIATAQIGLSPELDRLKKQLIEANAGRLLLPGDKERKKIRYYNGRFDCVQGTAYVQPTSAIGVKLSVKWAIENNQQFAIRGAGHSFEGRSSHPYFVIDLSRMTGHTLNTDGSLDVEAGVQLGTIYDLLSSKERILPAGTCPSVGIMGHVLGGGIGDFLPIYGYAAQQLEEAELVTLGGDIVQVTSEGVRGEGVPSELIHGGKNLLKLLRGAGQGSFGIVTCMKLRTHDVSNMHLASFKFARTGGKTVNDWFAWRKSLPKPMQSLVSSKLDLGRSGGSHNCEIAGLIAIDPSQTTITVSDVRRTLTQFFGSGEIHFRSNLRARAAVDSFIDDMETTHNPKRKMLYGASSALPDSLNTAAIGHLLDNMASNHSISIYTSGGMANAGVVTSLHHSEFIIEWTIYASNRSPRYHSSIRKLRSETIKLANFSQTAEDLGFPNYPDGEQRSYFINPDEIEAVAKIYDPYSLSTSSLRQKSPQELNCN